MFALGLATVLMTSMQEPDWPLTRAERTDFQETSHYEDVVEFIQALQAKGAPIRLEWMGESTEGKKMPLVIASRPLMTPDEARRVGRPIIYIQANIHAGEVEGKEAAQALLRDWCKGKNTVLDKAVLLMTPIYNIDGNERFGPVERNRPEQDGPAMVGVRANGQNFDLNRDCIKAESPEMRGVLEFVWKAWDPDVVMDLHTTDGTRHGYELTYSPPLNPNSDRDVMKYTRDALLPYVRKELRRKYGIELFDYGNVEGRGKEGRAWRSFEPLGRYVTNYAGLRNRISILSEATTFIPFKARVLATYEFVQSCVDYLVRNPKRVVELTRGADKRVVGWGTNPSKAPALGVAFDFDKRGDEPVILEKLAPGEPKPNGGRPKAVEKVKMPIYDRFKTTKTSPFPGAYFIPPDETALLELLRRHGIVVERIRGPWSGEADIFEITTATEASQTYQGHKAIRIEGAFKRTSATMAGGTYLVRTAQPLGTLAFSILEPESTDGAVTWGFLKETPKPGPCAIVKCPTVPQVITEFVK